MIEFPLSQTELRDFIVQTLGEDLGAKGDITSQAVIAETEQMTALMRARQDMIVSGLPLAIGFFQALSADIQIELFCEDGEQLTAGSVLMRITGPARAVLSAERPALNILQHLSGIATLTKDYVDKISHCRAKLLDTRKTIPGYRKLAKYATSCGGAHNHRMGLYDAILIKDNHIAAAGGITEAIKAAQMADHQDIEVECDTLEQMREALQSGATRILLDNMPTEMLKTAVEEVEQAVPLEASGGVTLDSIKTIGETGVDFISVGAALTLSAPAVDIGLDFEGQ